MGRRLGGHLAPQIPVLETGMDGNRGHTTNTPAGVDGWSGRAGGGAGTTFGHCSPFLSHSSPDPWKAQRHCFFPSPCSCVLFTLRAPPKGRPWLRLPALRGLTLYRNYKYIQAIGMATLGTGRRRTPQTPFSSPATPGVCSEPRVVTHHGDPRVALQEATSSVQPWL